MNKKFSFCIGRQWYEFKEDPNNICPYTIANQTIIYGDMDTAENLRIHVQSKPESKYPYDIYKLVKI
jgi:hypothetical protein